MKEDKENIIDKIREYLIEMGFVTYYKESHYKDDSLNYEYLYCSIEKETKYNSNEEVTFYIRYDKLINCVVVFYDYYDTYIMNKRHYQRALSNFDIAYMPIDLLFKDITNEIYNWYWFHDKKGYEDFWSL